MNFIEELRWRGMIHDMTPGTEEELAKAMTSAYIGYDPTSDSLHIGNLASIMMLVHFQKAGHKPFALVGGATGMIGDPSRGNPKKETSLTRLFFGITRIAFRNSLKNSSISRQAQIQPRWSIITTGQKIFHSCISFVT